jgi:hypothetical protein
MFRDWDMDYQKYREICKVAYNILGTEVAEKQNNTILDKLPFRLHFSRDEEKPKRDLDARMGFLIGSERFVEWLHDRHNHGGRLVVLDRTGGAVDMSGCMAVLGL